jgi:hypothetical protein
LSVIQRPMSAYAPDTSDRHAALARARGYPYPIPERSYHWRKSQVHDFDPARTEGRTPVLAVGSNQSPEQITRKFGHVEGAEIPVQRCTLQGFDVVYSAHIAGYGSVPAMLQAAPSTTVTLFVNWLDAAQLAAMHETELRSGNYYYGRLDEIALTLEGGETLTSVHGYISRRGHIRHGDEGIALVKVTAQNRQRPAQDTAQMLAHVHERIASNEPLDDFILRLIDEPDFRQSVIAELSTDSVDFAAAYKIVEE